MIANGVYDYFKIDHDAHELEPKGAIQVSGNAVHSLPGSSEALKYLFEDCKTGKEISQRIDSINRNSYYQFKKRETDPKHDLSKHIEHFAQGGTTGSDKVRAVADQYAKSKGLQLKHGNPDIQVNPARAKRLAQAYEEMKHEPNNPKVKKAYDALIQETLEQFRHIKNSGLKISKIEPGAENPYKSSKDVFHDIEHNNHLWFFPTESGYGSGGEQHPLLQPTDQKVGDHQMLANDVFRVVHDYFGHAKEGNGFGPQGEEKAWHTHKQMYSPEAQKALTSETRGQNSWVNFGPHGEENRKNPAKTVYAEQKAGLMPDFAVNESSKADGTEMMAWGGNAGSQRRRIFGTQPSPSKDEMREKHMEHIKKFARDFLGLQVRPSGGKIDPETGARRDENPEAGVDKPDWRSGQLESQSNPDAMIHELAHLMLLPKGVGLREGQSLMDQQFKDVQKNYGYAQQKLSQGEVQPMGAEQLIRRYLGLPPANNSVPVKDPESPLRQAVDDPTKVIGTRVQKKSGKWIDLIRQSSNLSPANRARIEAVLSGKIKFHPERGWEANKDYLGASIEKHKQNKETKPIADEHFLFSPENPKGPAKFKMTAPELVGHLRTLGEDAQHVKGKYGSEENSVLINNPKDIEGLKTLASNLGQESSIHSKGGHHVAHYHHGEHAGKVSLGSGTQWHEKAPKDFYSTISTPEGDKHFSHNIDWDTKYDVVPPQKMADGGVAGGGGDIQWDDASAGQQAAPQQGAQQPQGSGDIEWDDDKYGTGEQQAKAGVEGFSQGIFGPIAPAVETGLGIAKPEDILGRQNANPWTHGIGQGAGLVASSAAGYGLAPLLGLAGKGAAAATGLGELAANAPLIAKVGSAAVSQAAEMAVLQGGDEVSKMILQDPDTTAQSAIANVGLAGALGGAGGAFVTGAVSPLWKATAGPKVDSFLTQLTQHLNGDSKVAIPDNLKEALDSMGIELSPVMQSALSGDPKALSLAQELYRGQNSTFMEHLGNLRQQISEKVAQSMGIPLEDIARFSNAEEGSEAMHTFLNEVNEKYEPIAKLLNQRDELASTISIPDEERRDFGSKIMEFAVGDQGPGTDSDAYKIYENYAQRVMAKDTMRGLDQIKTELNLKKSLDGNETQAWRKIKGMIEDFQDNQIEKQSAQLEKEGAEHGSAIGRDIIRQRSNTNGQYAQYRKTMQELMDHVGLGNFKGTGTLAQKIREKVSPEDFLKKFSPKNNAEAINFLNENLPETAQHIQQNESKKFLSKFVKTDKGEHEVDYKGLMNAIEGKNGLLKGAPEYAQYVLPGDSLKTIQSGKVLHDSIAAITGIKDSGTPGGLSKVFSKFGAGALGTIGWMLGHNPISSAILGELTQRLAVDGPQAIKLATLSFMASDKPIEAAGFKASVDFMHQVVKGQSILNKSVTNLFKAGAAAIPDAKIPDAASLAKLDKLVAQRQDKPNEQVEAMQDGHLGHYMPNHQVAAVQSSTQALQYLQGLKPHDSQLSPLDSKIPPTPAQTARYNRALTIAQSPIMVLQHIKDGTLQSTDIQDLHSMYPALYQQYVQKISNEVSKQQASEEPIPYKTRMSMSLFLGQPMDTSMTPQSIMAAQPQPKASPPQQGGGKPKGKPKSSTSLNKLSNDYSTPGQTAEKDRSNRD